MTIQGAFLGLVIATLCGLLYHLVRGGPLRRLSLFVATAWVSFFSGHLVGNWIHWSALRLGTVNLPPALVATILGLIAADVLGRTSADLPPAGGLRPLDHEDDD